MHLAGTGTFSPVSEVVFIAVARGIGSCELIANDVRRGPLARSLSFPYHPHVTVAHDVPPDMLEFAYSGLADLSAEFRVDRFTEFEQTSRGGWAVAREYQLTGPPR
jgi:2'-5' RNA ligase